MAFDLKAILSLDDRMSSKLKAVTGNMGKLEKSFNSAKGGADAMSASMSKAAKSADGVSKNVRKAADGANRSSRGFGTATRAGMAFGSGMKSVGSSIKSMTSSVFSLNGAFIALAATYGTVKAAQGVFNATVGQAMDREQSQIVIGAMIQDEKKTRDYIKFMREMAIESPILDSKVMEKESRGFIAAVRAANDGMFNQKQIEKMWSITEKLAAYNPIQGTEGATFSFLELMSGDTVSMVDRFRIDKSVLNDLKSLPLDQMLKEFDEYLVKIGVTPKMIEDMGSTAAGKWQQIKESWGVILADMGTPALEPLKKFFDNILTKLGSGELNGFKNWGTRAITGILEGLTEGATGIYDWFTELTNSPEWDEKTTTYSKVSFVIEDIYERFLTWLDGEGKTQIEKTTTILFESLIATIDASMGSIIPVATKVGKALADGVIAGFKSTMNDSFSLNLLGLNFNTPMEQLNGMRERRQEMRDEGKPHFMDKVTKFFGGSPKKNGGLDRVPYNGATYSLHKDEAILTRGEANTWRKNKNNLDYRSSVNRKEPVQQTVNKNYNFGGGIHIHGSSTSNPKELAQQVLAEIVNLTKQAGEAGA